MKLNNRIKVIKSDICKQNVDAIVNAANSQLAGGGGVDGAIHAAAGPKLYDECKKLNGCPTGSSKITSGLNLPAKYIIHTVGPVWHGGNRMEDKLLRSCYINTLEIAKQKKINTIAFPNISTGVYGFPKPRAAEIAVNAVFEFLTSNQQPMQVIFVCFDHDNYELYKNILQKLV